MSPTLERTPGSDKGAKTGFAALGVAALAIACCAAGPLLVAVAGSLALGAALGVGAGVVALVGLTALVVVRHRRRRACIAASPAARPDRP